MKSRAFSERLCKRLARQIGSITDREMGNRECGEDAKIRLNIGSRIMPPPEPRMPVTAPVIKPVMIHFANKTGMMSPLRFSLPL